MSHFTVAVITESPDNLEKLLAPFQENNMGDCPKEFLEFNDVEPECRKKYETDSVERIKMPDGRLLTPWDDEFRIKGSLGIGTNSHNVPDKLERVQIPFNITFPTFEQYVEDWHGYGRDEETGKYGFWENPNAQWDWYQVGGRWRGTLTLNDGRVCDIAQIKDVAFKDDFGTYAVITPDGKWHSKGKMGWWGCSSETKEESEQFQQSYHEKFIASANPEHYIVIVDCHI